MPHFDYFFDSAAAMITQCTASAIPYGQIAISHAGKPHNGLQPLGTWLMTHDVSHLILYGTSIRRWQSIASNTVQVIFLPYSFELESAHLELPLMTSIIIGIAPTINDIYMTLEIEITNYIRRGLPRLTAAPRALYTFDESTPPYRYSGCVLIEAPLIWLHTELFLFRGQAGALSR
jgi:hypothetical protein